MAKPAIDQVRFASTTDGNTTYQVEPTAGLKNTGYTTGNKPAAQHHSWLFRGYHKWLAYLDELLGGATGVSETLKAGGLTTTGAVIVGGATTLTGGISGNATATGDLTAANLHAVAALTAASAVVGPGDVTGQNLHAVADITTVTMHASGNVTAVDHKHTATQDYWVSASAAMSVIDLSAPAWQLMGAPSGGGVGTTEPHLRNTLATSDAHSAIPLFLRVGERVVNFSADLQNADVTAAFVVQLARSNGTGIPTIISTLVRALSTGRGIETSGVIAHDVVAGESYFIRIFSTAAATLDKFAFYKAKISVTRP